MIHYSDWMSYKGAHRVINRNHNNTKSHFASTLELFLKCEDTSEVDSDRNKNHITAEN